jgi:hypothetical protein
MLRTIFHITPPISLVRSEPQKQEATTTPAKSVKTQRPTTNTPDSEKPSPPLVPINKKPAHQKRGKKMDKFLKTPKKFFLDSKNPRVRWLHIFFPKSTAT